MALSIIARRAPVALSDLDRRVLAALPMDSGAGLWSTVAEVAARADVATDAARSCLVELRLRNLADYDGVQGFARTIRGEVALEHGEAD